MKKRVVWLVMSCLMVAALVLASCAPAAPTEVAPTPEKEAAPTPKEVAPTPKEVAPTPKAEVTPTAEWIDVGGGVKIPKAVEVPKYGGQLNVGLPNPSQGFDIALIQHHWVLGNRLTNEKPWTGDMTRGLKGTGEYSFWQTGAPAWSGLGEAPALAESWEIPDANTIIFNIRKGVHFALNPKSEASRLVGGRELTAEDVAFNIERYFTAPLTKRIQDGGRWFRSVEVDGNKVIVKGLEAPTAPALAAIPHMGNQPVIYPPEVIEKYGDMRDWKNSVGTGPFMLVDYVSASAHTFVRNPDYWATDTVGPGKGMPLPYVDVVKWLDLRDVATRIAAFRTGKIDLEMEAEKVDADRLRKDNPELVWIKMPFSLPYAHVFGRIDTKPFDDVRVRRALAYAVDNQALADTLWLGDAEVYPYGKDPTNPVMMRLPFEKLPREAQMLFEYHPEEAKRLLAEAGYPDGFKTKVTIPAYPEQIDMMSMYKAYWAKIGVDLELDPREFTIFNSIRLAQSHEAMMINRTSAAGGLYHTASYRGKVQQNMGVVDDPYIEERYAKIWSWEMMGKEEERARLWDEIRLHVLEKVYIIEPPIPYVYRMWWPWLKNYHGEYSLGNSGYWKWAEFVWIDQELKKGMGFR